MSRKFTPAERDEIWNRYKTGGYSKWQLALEYRVSEKAIAVITNKRLGLTGASDSFIVRNHIRQATHF